MARLLWEQGSDRPGAFRLNFDEAFAVYCADDGASPTTIAIAWGGALDGQTVPWNPRWKIPPGEDRKVVILDRSSGREWDLYQVVYDRGRLKASNGSLVPGRYDSYVGANPPSRGAGIQYAAMLLRPWEVAEGHVRHALAMSINNTDGARYVPPAVKLEHPGRRRGIPEGTRFALAVSDHEIEDWISDLPSTIRGTMSQPARTLACALRDYGWFITDTGGAACFECEARASAEQAWGELGLREIRLGDGRIYPNHLLDGLITPERIYALADSDHY